MGSNYLAKEKLKDAIAHEPYITIESVMRIIDNEPTIDAPAAARAALDDAIIAGVRASVGDFVRCYLQQCVLSLCRTCKHWNADKNICRVSCGRQLCDEYPDCLIPKDGNDGKNRKS